ncbi:nuclease-related domain-containing protein [Marinilactibacillus sp. Marseille-P9653]|uniref:nuclease-related domain-containing protein n=1 Tax=Marinilactibacillus sp. Marseille-P9653 TaxID=2866583 RepID=UPI001CE3F7AC|nr:nuclease-related domain-containing protein [Marinilactibacillus sp. Marseille-P9653]
MIIAKPRTQPKLLKALTFLDRRTSLAPSDKEMLSNLSKGYEGETIFDQKITQYINKEVIVLNDLLLHNRGNSFQIDAMAITREMIYVYEIKNYQGDYINQPDGFTTINGIELSDPKVQVNKMKNSLSALFQKWKVEKAIEAKVVFIHPEFTLYHAEVNNPYILPTQVKKNLKKMNNQSEFLLQEDHRLAKRLVEAHQEAVPYQKQLPEYEWKQLEKGVRCETCGASNLKISQRTSYCKNCHEKKTITQLILCSIEEYRFLFPKNKLTTKIIYEWCGREVKRERIRNILKTHFTAGRKTNGQYYF